MYERCTRDDEVLNPDPCDIARFAVVVDPIDGDGYHTVYVHAVGAERWAESQGYIAGSTWEGDGPSRHGGPEYVYTLLRPEDLDRARDEGYVLSFREYPTLRSEIW